MNWKSVLTLCLVGIGLLLGAYFYGHYQGVQSAVHAPADTVLTVTPGPIAPPETVYVRPNPVPAKPRPDLTQTKIADSLILVVADKDSLIASLLTTQYASQKYSTQADSVLVVGTLEMLYYPINREFVSQVHIDSLIVPERVREIIRYVEVREFDWKLILGTLGVGVVIGSLIAQ